MSAWLVESREDYRQESEPVFWSESREVAERWMLVHTPKGRGNSLALYELLPDGEIGEASFMHFEPEVYRGPLLKARIDWLAGNRYVHRVPIDCATPSDRTLYEDYPLRVVANSLYPDASAYRDAGWGGMSCQCGEWQDIEGSPEKVEEMVAKYPH